MKQQLFIAAVLAASVAFADRITMNSGSVLTGTVNGIKEGVIKFTSDDFGDMDIDPGKVKSIEDARKTPVPVAELKVIPKDPETWHGSVNAAFLAARGNTYEDSWSFVANLNRRWEKDRFNGDFGYYYSKRGEASEDAVKSTDRWEVELKHDHFWWEKVYNYEDLRYDRDKIQELRGRYRLGLGGGYQWLENTEALGAGKFSFNQELGVNYVKEEYEHNDDAKSDGFAALRYGHHFGWLPKWNDAVEVFHNLEVLPEVDEWEKFLAKADVGFTTKIIYNFDLLCKIEWDYNSQPANHLKRQDTRYIVGLGYKW